jgi:putative DNA primase/helicase
MASTKRPRPVERLDAAKRAMVDKFLAELEEGIANPKGWTPTWHGGTRVNLSNPATGRRYSGSNAMYLLFSGHTGPFAGHAQWAELGANVRKGESGIPIMVPMGTGGKAKKRRKPATNGTQLPADGMTDSKPAESKDSKDDDERVPFRVRYVFGADQVDGWTNPATVDKTHDPRETVPAAEAIIAAAAKRVPIRYGASGGAYWKPTANEIHLPQRERFDTLAAFYGTAFHEIIHSTGHKQFLDRQQSTKFGSEEYGFEELVAEFGAAFLGQETNTATDMPPTWAENRDYLAGWRDRITDGGPEVLERAARLAQSAARLVQSWTPPATATAEVNRAPDPMLQPIPQPQAAPTTPPSTSRGR